MAHRTETTGLSMLQIHTETKKKLDELKVIPRESYNDVIVRLIEKAFPERLEA